MKDAIRTSLLTYLVSAAGLAGVMQPVHADPGGECRQEAELYAVPAEQFEEYVQGCVLSRGGDLPDTGSQNEVTPLVEGDPVSGVPDDMTTLINSEVEGNPDGTQ